MLSHGSAPVLTSIDLPLATELTDAHCLIYCNVMATPSDVARLTVLLSLLCGDDESSSNDAKDESYNMSLRCITVCCLVASRSAVWSIQEWCEARTRRRIAALQSKRRIAAANAAPLAAMSGDALAIIHDDLNSAEQDEELQLQTSGATIHILTTRVDEQQHNSAVGQLIPGIANLQQRLESMISS
jgi:hypothetical protein